MELILNNPVYHALVTGDKELAKGSGRVRYFDESVSPFAGIDDGYEEGFEELFRQLPEGRKILYATPQQIMVPEGWDLHVAVGGLQFVYQDPIPDIAASVLPVLLNESHIEEMIALATLTRPGPFGPGTISFGHYYGIFENGRLASMTGQRLHPGNYSEISAVCTHPDFLGKGYAAILIQQQLNLIGKTGRIPFLHVRDDNERAIQLYERLGFRVNGPMNFYFMKRGAMS
ncbi:MAG: GNAT family N-acetyltransferase [Flavisolibacter sp.]